MQKKLSKKALTASVAFIAILAAFAMVSLTFEGATATVTPGQNTVIFKESGLATGTSWSVIFDGTTHTSTSPYDNVSVTANGSYDFSLTNPNGYSGSPASGTLAITDYNVAGAVNVTEPIAFTSTAKTYQVTFYSGSYLTAGLVWSVDVNGVSHSSNTNTVSFNEPNGTYSFNIPDVGHWYAIPFSGVVTVAGNSNLPAWENGVQQTNITFRYGYLVTFSASGLPSYVPWSVVFNGTTNSTDGSHSSITFSIQNGTNYPYTISIAPNWKASPASGKLNVSGSAVSQTITFSELYYKVIFVETGLPVGTAWDLTVNGIPYVTTNGTVTLTEHNGSFVYSAPGEPGYTAAPANGTVNLEYSDVTVHIVYSQSTIRSQTNGTGGGITVKSIGNFFSNEYVIFGGILALFLTVFGAVLSNGRKKGKKEKKRYK